MPEAPRSVGKYVSVDGINTHYLEAGERFKGKAPTVLLLHSAEFGGAAELSWEFNIGPIGEHFHVLAPDHLVLLANAVTWAADETPPMMVTGPGILDIAYWRQKNSLAAHLVNMNNPMMMKGPYREIMPSGPYTVSLDIPAGAKVSAVRLLESGALPRTSRDGNRLVVEVPRIALHEVVAVDLA